MTRTVPANRLRFSEPFLWAPRRVWLPRGFSLEVADAAGFTAALEAYGWREPIAVRLGRRWPLSLAALALTVVALTVFYGVGLPAAARWAAASTPQALEQRLGAEVLALLDQDQLEPSELPRKRREALAQRLAEAVARLEEDIPCELEFRSVAGIGGINAFALPGGKIILLDGLIEQTTSDDQVLAILGHELGHVAHRHTLRHIAEAIGLGALTQLVWGEISAVVAQVPMVLSFLSYSRDDEREADAFAVRFLRENGLDARPLYEAFEILASIERRHRRIDVPDFLSTHPPTAERLERLRQQMEADERWGR